MNKIETLKNSPFSLRSFYSGILFLILFTPSLKAQKTRFGITWNTPTISKISFDKRFLVSDYEALAVYEKENSKYNIYYPLLANVFSYGAFLKYNLENFSLQTGINLQNMSFVTVPKMDNFNEEVLNDQSNTLLNYKTLQFPLFIGIQKKIQNRKLGMALGVTNEIKGWVRPINPWSVDRILLYNEDYPEINPYKKNLFSRKSPWITYANLGILYSRYGYSAHLSYQWNISPFQKGKDPHNANVRRVEFIQLSHYFTLNRKMFRLKKYVYPKSKI